MDMLVYLCQAFHEEKNFLPNNDDLSGEGGVERHHAINIDLAASLGNSIELCYDIFKGCSQ